MTATRVRIPLTRVAKAKAKEAFQAVAATLAELAPVLVVTLLLTYRLKTNFRPILFQLTGI